MNQKRLQTLVLAMLAMLSSVAAAPAFADLTSPPPPPPTKGG